MFINEKKHTIELSKKEAKAAAKFGTTEYKNLQEARKDYPTFSVATVSQKPAAKKNTYKGLTYDYMEMYIQMHDDEKKSIMAEYLMLRGLSDEAKENLVEAHSYIEMKKWFLNKFPAIREYHENCAKLVAA
ncbi:MAG: hypothetical protein MR939_03580 [Clostridiales bacterium]|nr:hypothetical protein [Clostridiales bacterium]MDD7386794.1 hypothetical protein [Bacillota bacterium]MDY6041006.1 hypothetical protein [Candidatus Faecousia sp.]